MAGWRRIVTVPVLAKPGLDSGWPGDTRSVCTLSDSGRMSGKASSLNSRGLSSFQRLRRDFLFSTTSRSSAAAGGRSRAPRRHAGRRRLAGVDVGSAVAGLNLPRDYYLSPSNPLMVLTAPDSSGNSSSPAHLGPKRANGARSQPMTENAAPRRISRKWMLTSLTFLHIPNSRGLLAQNQRAQACSRLAQKMVPALDKKAAP
jgi:hypothetical protein